MNQKSDLREEIERLIQAHPSGLTSAQIIERTGGEPDLVRSIINRLKRTHAARALSPGAPNTRYVAIDPDKVIEVKRISMQDGDYVPERDNPAAPMRPGSCEHESCPSRIGNRLFYLDGRVEDVK